MCRDIEIKILASPFGAMPFDYLKISEASIRKLRVLVETDLSLSRKLRRDEIFANYEY